MQTDENSQWYRVRPLLRIYLNQISTPASWSILCHASLLKWCCSLWSTEKAKWSIYTTSYGESEAARGRQQNILDSWVFYTGPSESKYSLHHYHFRFRLSGGSWETFLSAVLLSVFSSALITFAGVCPRAASQLFTPLRFRFSHVFCRLSFQHHQAPTRCTPAELSFLSHIF